MRTVAVHGVQAVCDDCEWLGPLRRHFGQAVTDERRHVHHDDAESAVYGLLALAGYRFTTPVVRRHVERQHH